MQDQELFDRALAAFRDSDSVVPPDLETGLDKREMELKARLHRAGVAPRVVDGSFLYTTFRGWSIRVMAPDDDSQWTALMCIIKVREATSPAAVDRAIRDINLEYKATQAARDDDDDVVITVTLFGDTEPSDKLLRRAYRLVSDVARIIAEAEETSP